MQFTLTLLALPLLTLAGTTRIGCYSSLPSSFTGGTQYQYQTVSYCATQCSSHSYFALTQGSTCICGDTAPISSASTDSCSVACFGYGSQTCGGTNSYEVFSNGGGGSVASSSSTGTTALSSSTQATNSASTTTASNKQTTTSSAGGTTTNTIVASKSTSAVTQEVSGTTIVLYSTVEIATSVTEVTANASTSASSTSTSASSTSNAKNSQNKKSTGTVVGAAVGGAVGGGVFIALIVIGFIFFKRRQAKAKEDAELADSAYFSAMKRDNTFGSHHERQISNPFIDKPNDMVDQRLNPVMLGRRRISEGSLADEADYSRKILRVANPDDED